MSTNTKRATKSQTTKDAPLPGCDVVCSMKVLKAFTKIALLAVVRWAVLTASQPDGAYIIVFTPESRSLQSAIARLVHQVFAAHDGLATSTVSYTGTVVSLTTLDGSSISSRDLDSFVDEVHVASPSAASQGIQAAVVKGASPAILAAIEAADNVAYVIPDLKTKAATSCTDAASISQGLVSSAAAPTTIWPGNKRCVDSNTQLVYIGERCGANFSLIQHTAIYAINRRTNTLKQSAGKDCVLLPRESDAKFNKQRLGGCGITPTMAPDLPTNLCPSSADNCIRPKSTKTSFLAAAVYTANIALKIQLKCGSKHVSRLTYSGIPCGPNQQFIAWVSATGAGRCHISVDSGFKPQHDVFGSCGVPPGAALHSMSMRICDQGLDPPAGHGFSPAPSPNPHGNTKPPSTAGTLKKIPVLAGQTIPAGVIMVEAATTAGIADPSTVPAADQVLVGVFDSGVDASHPDLNYVGGKSFLVGDTQPGKDDYGHGTHVAGVISAVNNAFGVVGVSPGTGIYSLKVLDATGEGQLSIALAAVKWVATDGVKLGIRIINLSLVTYLDPANPNYAAWKAAVCQYYKEASDAGVVVTAAAGNAATNLEGYFPAVCPHVIAVTALDSTGKAAALTYSNWVTASDVEGMAHTIAAPGTAILSTVPTSVDPSGYYMLTGTSGAAPHVAGVAANCIMSGACKPNNTGLQSMTVIMDAAKERVSHPVVKYNAQDTVASGKWFGYLLYSKY